MKQVNRESFLSSFSPQMRLSKAVFKKIYGYAFTTPEFAEIALARLENLGCSRAREYYDSVRAEIDREWNEMYKKVAVWYGRQYENGKAVRESRKDLKKMSNSELLTYLENLSAEA